MNDSIAALIRTHLPELAGLEVALLGEGTDHRVFEVGGVWVLRFPKGQEVGAALETEATVLRWLAPQLSLSVPAYELVSHALAGYRKLIGTPAIGIQAHAPALGPRLGTFLRALHNVEVSAAATLGVRPDDDPELNEWTEAAREDLEFAALQHLVSTEGHGSIGRFLLTPPPPSPLPPRLIHGDFAAEHVLLDDSGEPCGVIDWSDMILGDVAQDLGGLLHWGGTELLGAALQTYGPIDAATRQRARFYATCRALADLAFGQQEGRAEYVRSGRDALRWLFA